MRVVADFLIVIGVMLLTAASGLMLIGVVALVGHVSRTDAQLLVLLVMASVLGSAMLTTGILVHLRKWQKD